MNKEIILNFVFLQVLWFAAILGAAREWMLPASVWFLGFFLFYLTIGERKKQDAMIVFTATAVGLMLDTLWVQSGWLVYSYPVPSESLAPYWICMLWAGLGLTVNYSLRWLQTRLGLAAAFSLVSAPLSYFAASRFGSVDITQPLFFYPMLSVSWALTIPALLAFAHSLERPRIVGQVL